MVKFSDHIAYKDLDDETKKRLDPTRTKLKTESSFSTELTDIKNQYKVYFSMNPDLCKRMRNVGLGEVMIVKIVDRFKIENVHQKIFVEDPYHLMQIEGIGFNKADLIAKQLGIKNEDPRRQRALIRFTLESNKNFGNVYLPTTVLEKECKRNQVHKFKERLNELIEQKEVVLDDNRIYLAYMYVAECEVAEYINELMERG